MHVEVRKVTDLALLREIIGFILDKESTMTLQKAYYSRHSPMRTQLFLVKMEITTEVSVHLVRHSGAGQFHYVSSNRADWNDFSEEEEKEINRQTPVRHVMLLNAEHLLQIAEARLCTKALLATRQVVQAIKEEVEKIDPALAARMHPKCFRQGGVCYEDDPCGIHMLMLRQVVEQIPEKFYRDWRNDFAIKQANESNPEVN